MNKLGKKSSSCCRRCGRGIKNWCYSVVEEEASCHVPNDAISIFGSFPSQLREKMENLWLAGWLECQFRLSAGLRVKICPLVVSANLAHSPLRDWFFLVLSCLFLCADRPDKGCWTTILFFMLLPSSHKSVSWQNSTCSVLSLLALPRIGVPNILVLLLSIIKCP